MKIYSCSVYYNCRYFETHQEHDIVCGNLIGENIREVTLKVLDHYDGITDIFIEELGRIEDIYIGYEYRFRMLF